MDGKPFEVVDDVGVRREVLIAAPRGIGAALDLMRLTSSSCRRRFFALP
jgi:hypothetical protein